MQDYEDRIYYSEGFYISPEELAEVRLEEREEQERAAKIALMTSDLVVDCYMDDRVRNVEVFNEAIIYIRYEQYKEDIETGRIILDEYTDLRIAAHSEIRALDEAIKARRAAGFLLQRILLKNCMCIILI